MKRLVVILLSLAILVLSSQVEAGPFDVFHRVFNIWGPSSGSGGDDCSTPQLGNVMNEGFLGTGYELSWTETIGDGTYNGFSVDAGLIGCVHADLIEEGSTFRDSPECGRLVEFKEPFTVQAYSNGDIRIGNITVETGHDYEEEEEDEDFDYEYDED